MATSQVTVSHDFTLSLEDFFENGTIGLHLVGPDGTILRANRADYAPLGYTAEEYIGHSIARFHADEHVIDDILKRLSAGERLDKYPARLRAKDGSIRHVLISSSVHFEGGQFQNTRCFTLDVTDKVLAEAALREAQDRLAATYDNVRAGIAECNESGRFLRVNDAFETISGYSKADLLSMTFFDITDPEDVEQERLDYRNQVAGTADHYMATKRYVRKDGRVVWVEVTSSTVRRADGGFAYGVRMVQDITERKTAEEHRKFLLDELNHRVKNTLATVQALAAHTARSAKSADDFRRRFEPRLMALSAAHDRLTKNDWRGANLADIVGDEVVGHGGAERVDASGPDVLLSPRVSLSLSMALHELATNAMKYGALSCVDGRVAIRWSVMRDSGSPHPISLSIEWQERGGPKVATPTVTGFGSRLLKVTAAELKGEADLLWRPEGLIWQLSIPLRSQDVAMPPLEGSEH